MQAESLLGFLIIGAVAGWIAGKLMQGGGFGVLGNIVVGVLGAVIGGAIFGFVGIASGGCCSCGRSSHGFSTSVAAISVGT